MPSGKPPEVPNNAKTDDGFAIPLKRPRGRPRKTKDDDNASVNSFMSTNTFGDLTDDDPGEQVIINKRLRVSKPKLPPPIVVHNLTSIQINELIRKCPISDDKVRRKLTQHGVKLYVDTVDEFKTLRDFLNKSNTIYYTYTLDEEKRTKIVLYGLPSMDEREIALELSKYEVKPVEVRKFKIKKSRYQEHTNYLLYFAKNDNIRVATLREIRALFHYVVSWEYYRSTKRGPTQCRRCQAFGHSHNNCKLQQKCMKCSENHETDKCPYTRETIVNGQKTFRCQEDKLLCANCGEKHTALFKDCKSRLSYVDLKQKTSNRISQNQNKQKQRDYTSQYRNYSRNFPSLTATSSTHQTPNHNYWSSSTAKTTNSNDLFSPHQLFSIFNEIVQLCNTCSSKSEQIAALSAIYQKHVINNGS